MAGVKSKYSGILLLVVGLAVIGLLSIGTVVALNVTNASRSLSLRSETVQADGNSTVLPIGWEVATSTQAASGDVYGGTDATATSTAEFAGIQDAHTLGNWVYKFTVQESGPDSWATSTIYAIKVYFDQVLQTGASATTTVFFNNSTRQASSTEGVTVRVGSSASSSIPQATIVQVELVTP